MSTPKRGRPTRPRSDSAELRPAGKQRTPRSDEVDEARDAETAEEIEEEEPADEGPLDESLEESGDTALELAPSEEHLDTDEDYEPLAGDEGERRTTALARTGDRALARFDPLTLYAQEIRRYPLLSREEEHELAVRYVETGDLEIARRLITANLRLVLKIAHEYRQAHRNLLDLVQEGNIGLMQAVRKYDPYRGVKLSSYAAWWIRAYILKFILNNWRMVKIGTTQAQRRLFFNLRKEREKLEREGFIPDSKLLAERLDVTPKEVDEMERRMSSSDLSLDAPVGHEDEGAGRSHLDLLPAAGELRPDVAAEADEFRALLREKLAAFEKTLSGRELVIFRERLHSETPLTLQEIGDRYGVSRERARQLEKRLSDRLRDYLSNEMGEAVQIAMGIEE